MTTEAEVDALVASARFPVTQPAFEALARREPAMYETLCAVVQLLRLWDLENPRSFCGALPELAGTEAEAQLLLDRYELLCLKGHFGLYLGQVYDESDDPLRRAISALCRTMSGRLTNFRVDLRHFIRNFARANAWAHVRYRHTPLDAGGAPGTNRFGLSPELAQLVWEHARSPRSRRP